MGLPAIGTGFVLAIICFRRKKGVEGEANAKIMAAAMVTFGLSLTGVGIGLAVHHRQCERVLIAFGVTVGAAGLSTGVGIVSFFYRRRQNIKAEEGILVNGSDVLNQPVDEHERNDNRKNESIGDDEGCSQKESGDVPSKLKVEQASECGYENSKHEAVVNLHQTVFDGICA